MEPCELELQTVDNGWVPEADPGASWKTIQSFHTRPPQLTASPFECEIADVLQPDLAAFLDCSDPRVQGPGRGALMEPDLVGRCGVLAPWPGHGSVRPASCQGTGCERCQK